MKKISVCALFCLLAAGCTESTSHDGDYCNCNIDQVCDDNTGKCLDTCSETKLCSGGAECVNHICRSSQEEKCKSGTKRCSEDMARVLICNANGTYDTDQECGEGNICDSATCVPDVCDNGTKRCRNNNVEICYMSVFQIYTECEQPSVCDETQKDCVTPAICTENEKRCSAEGNVESCDKGTWVQTAKCSESAPCNTTTFSCASEVARCTGNEQSCADKETLMICNGGEWQETKCQSNQVCYKDECNLKCVENASECTSDTLYRKCNSMGMWVDHGCSSGQICNDQSGEVICEGTCTENTYSCDGNILKQCVHHEVTTVRSCEINETCDAVNGQCIPNCGNGHLDTGEACDTTVPSGKSCQTEKGADYTGSLSCTTSCTIDTSGCTIAPYCGDEHLDTGEACDTTVPSDKSCQTEMGNGYTGSLSCTSSCTIDTSKCIPSSVSWDYTQTFAAIITVSNQYKTENTFSENGIEWIVKGRTQMTQTSSGVVTDYSINDQGVIFKYDKDTPNSIKASGLTKGIGMLAFDYRSWGGTSDNGIVKITAGSFSEELNFKKAQTTPEVYSATINANVTSFTIESTKGGRIIIDNVRWTNK